MAIMHMRRIANTYLIDIVMSNYGYTAFVPGPASGDVNICCISRNGIMFVLVGVGMHIQKMFSRVRLANVRWQAQ